MSSAIEPPEPPAPEPPAWQLDLERLQAGLGADVLQHEATDDDLWVRVAVHSWAQAAAVAKEQLGCGYLCFLSGIDWLPNPNLNGEKTFAPQGFSTEPQTVITDCPPRMAGGNSRFQVFARVANLETHAAFTLLADLDDTAPTAPSWVSVYPGADWHEREAWEMYGIDFPGHPGLRHLYLPGEFEGHPLRKDFPLLARELRPWPGLVDLEEMPGLADGAGSEPEEDFA